jgi:Cu-Zn family superoxide dismutase
MARCVCNIRGEGIVGHLTLVQEAEDKPTSITGEIRGLSEGPHGFQLRTYGDLSDDLLHVGPVYNPFGHTHGGPGDAKRCIGDLGNITANPHGVAPVHMEDKYVKLIGPLSVIGRSIAVFQEPDDLGRGGHADSMTTGNVGRAIAAGVVGIGAS